MSVGIGQVWLSYGEVKRMFDLGDFFEVSSGDGCV
jgi:hypothetical protein